MAITSVAIIVVFVIIWMQFAYRKTKDIDNMKTKEEERIKIMNAFDETREIEEAYGIEEIEVKLTYDECVVADLYYFKDYTQNQIAEKLGKSPRTIRRIVENIKKKCNTTARDATRVKLLKSGYMLNPENQIS